MYPGKWGGKTQGSIRAKHSVVKKSSIATLKLHNAIFRETLSLTTTSTNVYASIFE